MTIIHIKSRCLAAIIAADILSPGNFRLIAPGETQEWTYTTKRFSAIGARILPRIFEEIVMDQMPNASAVCSLLWSRRSHATCAPIPERFIAHCRWLLSQNCGLAVFERIARPIRCRWTSASHCWIRCSSAGLDPGRMMPGTGCCALTDTVRLTEHAVKAGCAGVYAATVLLQRCHR